MYQTYMKMFSAWIVSMTLVVPTIVHALEYEPVVLNSIAHLNASLTVIDAQGSAHTYTIPELETFPAYRLTTTTPWRNDETEFTGVRLFDVLARHNLQDASEIRVIAENNYASVLPNEVWTSGNILIATRANEAPIPRRARGPILFVAPATVVGPDNIIHDKHLVWMAMSISLNPK